jgi:hypothetical protein
MLIVLNHLFSKNKLPMTEWEIDGESDVGGRYWPLWWFSASRGFAAALFFPN